ncbi:hypothetical protein PG990_014212 [Apiospora arundinis]
MALVFSSNLGRLVQTQFGVNEIASCVIVGKRVGSLLTRKSDAAVFQPLCSEYGLFVRSIPKYLEPFTFDRPGIIYGKDQRTIKAPNVLEDVNLASIEGIATLLVLILRHTNGRADLVDYVADLLKGSFWLVGCPSADSPSNDRPLPFSLREVLRSFVSSVDDADMDTPQTKRFRMWMTTLAMTIGSAEFSKSSGRFAQYEQDRFLGCFLGSPEARDAKGTEHSNFDTLSARAALVAIACAANGANVQVRCMTKREGPVFITEPIPASKDPNNVFTFTLWLVQPPSDVAKTLRSYETKGNFEPRFIEHGPMPIFGGQREIIMLVASQLGLDINDDKEIERQIDLWKSAKKCARDSHCDAKVRANNAEKTLLFMVAKESLSGAVVSVDRPKDGMPMHLVQLAQRHFDVSRSDPRNELGRLAASVVHDVLKLNRYDDEEEVKGYINLVVVALMVGWIEDLASPESQPYGYGWTADAAQLRQYAEIIVSEGLTLQQILLTAARMWGGLPPSFSPFVPANASLVGIACPQITILLDVLIAPTEVAQYGMSRGLFSLYRGSTPMIPRDQLSGLVFAGDMNHRTAITDVGAEQQIPPQPPIEEQLLFTLEPERKETGSLAAILCGWFQGEPRFELDPAVVLAGLLGERTLQRMTTKSGPSINRITMSHMSPRKLLEYASGFKVRNGNVLVRAGSRTDLQVLAAGCHMGLQTVMVVDESDAELVRAGTVLSLPDSPLAFATSVLELPANRRQMGFPTDCVFIFCSDKFPPDFTTALSQYNRGQGL